MGAKNHEFINIYFFYFMSLSPLSDSAPHLRINMGDNLTESPHRCVLCCVCTVFNLLIKKEKWSCGRVGRVGNLWTYIYDVWMGKIFWTYIVEFIRGSRLAATKIYVLYNTYTQYILYKYAKVGTFTYVEQTSLSRVPYTNIYMYNVIYLSVFDYNSQERKFFKFVGKC
jgi:hypothetical protein